MVFIVKIFLSFYSSLPGVNKKLSEKINSDSECYYCTQTFIICTSHLLPKFYYLHLSNIEWIHPSMWMNPYTLSGFKIPTLTRGISESGWYSLFQIYHRNYYGGGHVWSLVNFLKFLFLNTVLVITWFVVHDCLH